MIFEDLNANFNENANFLVTAPKFGVADAETVLLWSERILSAANPAKHRRIWDLPGAATWEPTVGAIGPRSIFFYFQKNFPNFL